MPTKAEVRAEIRARWKTRGEDLDAWTLKWLEPPELVEYADAAPKRRDEAVGRELLRRRRKKEARRQCKAERELERSLADTLEEDELYEAA